MLGWGAVALLTAIHSGPGPGPGVVMEWSAPSRCPTAQAVQQRLTDALVDSAADPRGMRARATVTEDDAGRFALVLELERDDGPAGRRTMQASDCNELAKAAVLIVALAVDPEVDLAQEPPPEPAEPAEPAKDNGDEASPMPEPPPAPTEPRIDETTPKTEPDGPNGEDSTTSPSPPTEPEPTASAPALPRSRAPALHIGLDATAGVGLSVLPAPTAVVALGAALWGNAWRAELGASYWTPVDSIPTGDTIGGRLQQWTIDARGCGLLQPGPLELPLCAGVDVGAVHGRGLGVVAPRQVSSLRLALAAGAGLLWSPTQLRGRLALRLNGDVLVALARARFRATPTAPGLVYYTPPVGGRVSAGLEVRLR
ncbi:MAG: hypothetical protein AAGF11_19860 [Myxococcota bacterium]